MNEPNEAIVSKRRMRWWMPAGIVCLAGATIAYLQFASDVEGPFRNMYSVMTGELSVLLLVVWFVFFTGLRWRTRLFAALGIIAAAGGIGFLVASTVRMDGSITGAGMPKLTWRWTPKPDAGVRKLEVAATARDPAAVDLATTCDRDFPQFLGVERLGVVRGVHLAQDWTAEPPRELWRQPIGVGWSSFAVVGSWAVTQEQRGDHELTVCYEVTTGKAIWQHSNAVRFSEGLGGDGPRATPTIDAGRVYVLGATGILDCLDGSTGEAIWSRDILRENELPNLVWGKSSSPLVVDDFIVVSGGDVKRASLLAYRKQTGEPAWRAGADKGSYSSPVLATLGGVRQILSVNAGSVTGHDPANGRELWNFPWPGDFPKASQPVALSSDRVFASAGYGVGCALLELGGSEGGPLRATEIWRNQNMKTQFTNVVVRDGFAYGLDDGILACIDLATGERQWKGGRYGHGQVLLVNDTILIQAESGAIVLAAADRSAYRELTRFPALTSKTWNNPALSGRYLLVRNDREAACFELPLADPASASLGRGYCALCEVCFELPFADPASAPPAADIQIESAASDQ